MTHAIIVLICAFVIDLIFGDPSYKLHPVRIIGNTISLIEEILFKLRLNGIFGGVILTLVMLTLVPTFYACLSNIISIYLSHYVEIIFGIYILYSSIALKDLLKHAENIYISLFISTEKAQQHVQMIVGRDARLLDDNGIIKATIESVAESYVDGILSPFFWMTIGSFAGLILGISPFISGISAALIQRTVNTIDSMIGYKNEKYILFGKFGARLDDVFNFIPARLSTLIIVAGAFFMHYDYKRAWKVGLRDRLNHKSPNSAHPEAAVAGALGIRLGGPTVYKYGRVEKPYIGDDLNRISPDAIKKAEKLITTASWIGLILFSGILFLL